MSTTVTTTAVINASPEDVWSVLTDFPAYEREGWNPFIRAIGGMPLVGGKLVVSLAGNGGKGMTFKPRVLVAEPARELRWVGKLGFGGLFDGEHSFVLSGNLDGTTTLVHAEEFSGLLVALMRGASEGSGAGFEKFNDALRQRCEKLRASR